MSDKQADWSPFKRNGKLNIVFATDPWWKRFWYVRIRRQPIWYRLGALVEEIERRV